MQQSDHCHAGSCRGEHPIKVESGPVEHPILLPQNKLVRVLLGSLLLTHFGILFLNNLAWSPAIAAAWPFYAPYVDRLGLVQDWVMYRDPNRFDQRIIVEGFTTVGRQPISRNDLGWTSSRMLYFVEGLCTRNSTTEASAYLSWLFEQIPEESRPERGLALRKEVKQISQPTEKQPKSFWRTASEFVFWTGAAQ